MQKCGCFFSALLVSLLWLSGMPAHAQGKKTLLWMPPKPMQTDHCKITIEHEEEQFSELSSEEPSASNGAAQNEPPIKRRSQIVLLAFQESLSPDEQQRPRLKVTLKLESSQYQYDARSLYVPLKTEALRPFTDGVSFVLTFSPAGRVADLQLFNPKGQLVQPALMMGGMDAEFFALATNLYGEAQATRLSLGETVSVPMKVLVPQHEGLQLAEWLSSEGTTKYTLHSVRPSPVGRIARLNRTVQGKLINDLLEAVKELPKNAQAEQPNPTGAPATELDIVNTITVHGSGFTEINLNTGLVHASQLQLNFVEELKIREEVAGHLEKSLFKTKGTTKITLRSLNQ